mgnify:CR=1 FL=1
MPYINTVTPKKITPQQQENIRKALGRALLKIAGKGDDWLMLSFQDEVDMSFHGQESDTLAYIELKLVGVLTPGQKKQLVEEIGHIYENELGIPTNKSYIVIFEVSGANWGWNGGTFG